jgi:microsomal dipeptidase-like Zn-dependent dipeptidase
MLRKNLNRLFIRAIIFFLSLLIFYHSVLLPVPVKAFTPEEDLWGFADMHTHPMSNLGFGGHLVYGAPDIGSLVPVGTYKCNTKEFRAKTMEEAMGDCSSSHGMQGAFTNKCGNHFRHLVLSTIENVMKAYPDPEPGPAKLSTFHNWPRYDDIMHQHMWVDWLKRSYEGGLRVMVALAVNNRTLAGAVRGVDPKDDLKSGNLQISEMKRFVSRHSDFMEIAYSPAGLKNIVRRNKLAIVLGVEMDNIGDFNLVPDGKLTGEMITSELDRLYEKGVRYIFPVHVINNKFSGTAIYLDVFNLSNKVESGKYWNIGCSSPAERITHRYNFNENFGMGFLKLFDFGILPFDQPGKVPVCPPGTGHVNQMGLTPEGRFAITEMMKRGMMVDIDHMSRLAANQTLELAENFRGGYPLNSGHNIIQPENGDINENYRTVAQLKRIAALGGMFGLGWSQGDSATFLKNYRSALKIMDNKNIAIGTDVNGLVTGPAPRPGSRVIYNNSFKMCSSGYRCWDYNREGVAHYGLLPDFIQDLRNMGAGNELDSSFFHSAGYFYRMWDKCLAKSGQNQ